MKRVVLVLMVLWGGCRYDPSRVDLTPPCPAPGEVSLRGREVVAEEDLNTDGALDRLVVDRRACGAYGDCPYALVLSCGEGAYREAWTGYAQSARMEGGAVYVTLRSGETGAETRTESKVWPPASP